jgi:hypothetical protein
MAKAAQQPLKKSPAKRSPPRTGPGGYVVAKPAVAPTNFTVKQLRDAVRKVFLGENATKSPTKKAADK